MANDINPFDHGPLHTDLWKTQGLRQALDAGGFDAAFGGARRDEEKSRAKERIFSFRSAQHRWDPKRQRPELWSLYNVRKAAGESMRVFPLSNWTELDIWQYIMAEQIEIVPLYLAAPRPTVTRDGLILMVDDDRFRLEPGEQVRRAVGAVPDVGLLPLVGRGRERGRHDREGRPGNAAGDDVGTAGSDHRPRRRRRVDGEEEAGGLFLMARLDADEALIASDITLTSRATATSKCCASSPAGRSTMASRR